MTSSVGPTTSMRMEKFEKEFIRQTGVCVIVGKGGMVAYTGVNDLRVLTEKANEGDAKIQELLDAYYFQIAKEIACKSIALHGQVDQIILTGGVAYGKEAVAAITDLVSWIAPVTVYPGEDVLLALAQAALRVLNGEEQAKEY